MLRSTGILGVLFALLPVSAAAQSPAPVGTDNEVLDLVVDPTDYRGNDFVYLVDEGTLRAEEDGTYAYSMRQVVQIMNRDGAETWGELGISYYPERQDVHLDWLRVARIDGTVLSEGPEHRQESARAANSGAPIYSDAQLVQLTVGGIGPGTVLDFQYTIETTSPRLPGDLLYHFAVNTLTPILRSRFTIDAPVGNRLQVQENNLDHAVTESTVDGRSIRVWEARDIPAIELQSYIGWPNDVVQSIVVSGGLQWDEIAEWYTPYLADRYTLTREIEAAHDAQLEGARSWDDSLSATYRWVAQDFRYVSLSLGDGAYQPRTPAMVFESGFGDCKDKAVFFNALARRMGMAATPVLVSINSEVDSLAPSLKQFDHMISQVRKDGASRFFDLTTELTPYGELPDVLQGSVGVALGRDGGAEVVVLPASAPEENHWERTVSGRIERDNRFVGSVTFSATGTKQYDLREYFARFSENDQDDQDDLVRELVQSATWANAVVDSSAVVEGRDLSQPVSVTIWFTSADVLGNGGSEYSMALPVGNFANASVATDLEEEGERRFPIDIGSVNSPDVVAFSLELELPDGWKAQTPKDVSVRGGFGYYEADYRQIGNKVSIHRAMGGLRGTASPDSIDALKAWFEAVAEDDVKSLTIERGAGLPLVTGESSVPSGRLPDVLLSADDFDDVVVVAEGDEQSDDLLTLTTVDPKEMWSRTLAAEELVFTVGESSLMLIMASAAAYETALEAAKGFQYLDLMDVPAFMTAAFEAGAEMQASLSDARQVDLSELGESADGWAMKVEAPLLSMDMALLMVARGRVVLSAMVLGASGMSDQDLRSLFTPMVERLDVDEAYLDDLPVAERSEDTSDSDLVLADSIGVPLDRVPPDPAEFEDTHVSVTEFERDDDVVRFRQTLESRGPTFSTGTSEAIILTTELTRYETQVEAVKAYVKAERQDLEAAAALILDDLSEAIPAAVGGDAGSLTSTPVSGWPTAVAAHTASLRGALRLDLDMVYFVRDRYVVSLWATRGPDASAPADVLRIARDVDGRLEEVLQDSDAGALSDKLVTAVRRVLAAEAQVDSLVDAREIDAAFAAMEAADLDDAPVGFAAGTLNSLCWWASLHGQAERAMPVCEAAVSSNSTSLSILDSRGLNRALIGDTEGAIEDFTHIVDRAADGAFLDVRSAWLDALTAGENPFTEAELARLRGDP